MRRLHLSIFALAALTIGCKDKQSGTPEDSPDQSWSPATLTSVAGVPEAEIEAALKKRIAGSPPGNTDKHKWEHAKKLYKRYSDKPLWLASDGLIKDRSL